MMTNFQRRFAMLVSKSQETSRLLERGGRHQPSGVSKVCLGVSCRLYTAKAAFDKMLSPAVALISSQMSSATSKVEGNIL